MADTTTTAETAATTPTGTELARIVQGGNNRKTTLAVIGHQFRGARARKTSDDVSADYSTETALDMDVADFDTDSFWSAGTPSRLTIPAGAGIIYVELTGQVISSASAIGAASWTSITQYSSADAVKRTIGQRVITKDGLTMTLAVSTGPLAVDDGDYFQLRYRDEDTSVVIEGDQTVETFIALTVLGMEPL
jgi:hypothetical protein